MSYGYDCMAYERMGHSVYYWRSFRSRSRVNQPSLIKACLSHKLLTAVVIPMKLMAVDNPMTGQVEGLMPMISISENRREVQNLPLLCDFFYPCHCRVNRKNDS
jgi:hypothetical protein